MFGELERDRIILDGVLEDGEHTGIGRPFSIGLRRTGDSHTELLLLDVIERAAAEETAVELDLDDNADEVRFSTPDTRLMLNLEFAAGWPDKPA